MLREAERSLLPNEKNNTDVQIGAMCQREREAVLDGLLFSGMATLFPRVPERPLNHHTHSLSLLRFLWSTIERVLIKTLRELGLMKRRP